MLAVIVVIAILIVLGVALLDSSTMGFSASKHEETAELAYRAAESGIERCFGYIDDYCSVQSNTSGIDYFHEDDFAIEVTGNVFTKLRTDLSGSPVGKALYQIGLSSNVSDMADVEITQIKFLEVVDNAVDGNSGKIKVTIGVKAIADYNRSSDKASNKVVFAKKDVIMFIPRGFVLNAAIYSVGDFMVDNINAQVIGDVVAYGTAPKFAKKIQQYYYGGIYAKNSGHLSVDGNAYSRGLIRTGQYNSTADPSSIYVYRDAIANGIHIFGNGQKIVVCRNAYTFDDLELNGEDSVIAVNGSYVGLSNDTAAKSHDQSSAIVNSAIVHYAGSNESLKSRVVINGDVIINGGTFRIDPLTGITDEAFPQIEDASVVVTNSELSLSGTNSPMYREYQAGNGIITMRSGGVYPTYHEWLSDNEANAKGFANLIQCWSPRTDLTSDSAIKTWTDDIDTARGIGTNNITPPATISGFCHYEIGANNKMYFLNQDDISRINFIDDNCDLDNIPVTPYGIYWKDFWTFNSISDWKSLEDDRTPTNPLSMKLKQLTDWLKPLTEIFASRNYTYPADADADAPIDNIFNSTSNPSVDPVSGLANNTFLDLGVKLNTKYPDNSNKYVFNFTNVTGTSININTELSARIDAATIAGDTSLTNNNFFLFINNDPSKELIINGKVNGIIYSLGKVVVQNGAEVTGSILAAGRGYTNESALNYVSNMSSANQSTTGQAIYLPQIMEYGDNIDRLDDGSYAGVHFKGSAVTETATVKFPGKVTLYNQFITANGLDINSIFNFNVT